MSFAEQIEKAFAEREHLAEQVLTEKQAIIDYDRRRNGNREALNQFKGKLQNEKKVWLHFGDMFIKLPTADAKSYIENEQTRLSAKIESSRNSMKQKTKELEALEGKHNLQGFDLVGMKASDLYGIIP